WRGEGPEGDKWLPASNLEECEALDRWQTWKEELQGLPNAKELQKNPRLTITIPPRPRF
ncbi:hypothetical protein EI94DRAFT_1574204, partial [Lactarius quietus]